MALSDNRPIRIIVEMSRTQIHAKYVGNSGSSSNLAQSSMKIWTNSLLAANGGSGVEMPPGEDIVIDVPIPVFEIEEEIISPSIRLKVTLPWGIGFSNYKSEMGRGEIGEEDGSEVLPYFVPMCTTDTIEECDQQSDTMSFRVLIGVDFILLQLAIYIGVLIGFFLLFCLAVKPAPTGCVSVLLFLGIQ